LEHFVPDPCLKKPIVSIAEFGTSHEYTWVVFRDRDAMEQTRFEPFGEYLPQDDDSRPRGRASRWVLWTGSAIFWSAVTFVVVARAAFFDPAVFADFSRLASLAQSML
jgi:hypothetical protein